MRFLYAMTLCQLDVQTGSQTEDIIYPPVIPNNTMVLGIYAPNAINKYSEKKTLIAFQIKMVLLFPSVNSCIYSQPASFFLLGEDKLTKKHVTNLMHFHFAPVSNVTFVIKHAA